MLPPNALGVVIVGCGDMGCNIAGELLRRGCNVRLYDASSAYTLHTLKTIRTRFQQHQQEGLFDELSGDVDRLMSRCKVAENLQSALEGFELVLVVEAVPEILEIKRVIFSDVAAACAQIGLNPRRVLLSSNTKTLEIADIARMVPPPYTDRVIGLRFLFPCWFVDLVDLDIDPKTPHVARDTYEMLKALKLTTRPQPGESGTQLLYEEALLYAVRQQEACAAHAGTTRPALTTNDQTQPWKQLIHAPVNCGGDGATTSVSVQSACPKLPAEACYTPFNTSSSKTTNMAVLTDLMMIE